MNLTETLDAARRLRIKREEQRQAEEAAAREHNRERTRRMWEAVPAAVPQGVAHGVLVCEDCDDDGILDSEVNKARVWCYLDHYQVSPFYFHLYERDGVWTHDTGNYCYFVPGEWEARWSSEDAWHVGPARCRIADNSYTNIIDAIATAMDRWEEYHAAKQEAISGWRRETSRLQTMTRQSKRRAPVVRIGGE